MLSQYKPFRPADAHGPSGAARARARAGIAIAAVAAMAASTAAGHGLPPQAWIASAALALLLALALSAWRRYARARRSLDASRSALRELQQLAGIGSLRYRLHDGGWHASSTFVTLAGLAANSGRGSDALLRPLDRRERVRLLRAVRAAWIDGDTFDCDMLRLQLPDGGLRWVHLRARVADDTGILLCTIQDISRRCQDGDAPDAPHARDALTGLPGQGVLANRLAALQREARQRSALLVLDLDHFAMLNTAHGSDRGNLLLRAVAARLQSRLDNAGLVTRIRADRFAVLLTGLPWSAGAAHEAALRSADVLRAALAESFDLDGLRHACTASVGVALGAPDAPPARELMRRAESALTQAKGSGRDLVRVYDPAMEAVETARLALENDLRLAVASGQFELHYQAQVDCWDRILGAEVLVRWRHPLRGLVPPASFIPLCEATGMILPLGRWVLETACARLAAWTRDPRLGALTLAVNVSACQFSEPGFVDQVMHMLRHNGVDPRRLKLELTEGLLLANTDGVIATLHALKQAGVGISLDDFGTGYSSLAYLKRLPIDQLKIDRTFVADVLTDPNDLAIVRTVVALGRSFGLDVVAEGVETEAQRTLLTELGCGAFQGYLFSRPLPLAGFEELVRAQPDAAGLLAARGADALSCEQGDLMPHGHQ